MFDPSSPSSQDVFLGIQSQVTVGTYLSKLRFIDGTYAISQQASGFYGNESILMTVGAETSGVFSNNRKLGKEIGLGDADKESGGWDGSLLGYINIPNATFVVWDRFLKTVAIDSMFTQIAENRAPIPVALLEYTPAKQLSSVRHLQQYQDHFLACCKSTSLHEVVDFPVKVRESSSVRHDSCSFRKVWEVSGLTGCK